MANLSRVLGKFGCAMVSVAMLAVNLQAAPSSATKKPLAVNSKQKPSKVVKQKSANSIKKSQAGKVDKSLKMAKTKGRAIKSSKVAKVSLKPAVAAKVATASFGSLYGLDKTPDPLDLQSSVALVIDSQTNEVLLSKNSSAVLPIASITKLMTSLVVLDAAFGADVE